MHQTGQISRGGELTQFGQYCGGWSRIGKIGAWEDSEGLKNDPSQR